MANKGLNPEKTLTKSENTRIQDNKNKHKNLKN